jgi:predicted RecA/RadA family phage recombinase
VDNYQQRGESVQWTNGTGVAVAAGQPVAVGNMIGVAIAPIAIAGSGPVAIEGVFSNIPKVTAAVFVQGEKLIWDASVGKFDDSAASPATGDITGAVVAMVAGTSSDTTCTVKLTPGNSTITA